jgi:hypothetical protein
MTRLSEDQLVDQIVTAWGDTPEVQEMPYGKSRRALQAMARQALRGLGIYPRTWGPGEDIPAGVDTVYTGSGLDFRRDDPNGDEEHSDRWILILSSDEITDRFGTVSEEPPSDDIIAGRVRASALHATIRLAETIDTASETENRCGQIHTDYGWTCDREPGHISYATVPPTWHRDSMRGHSWADRHHHTGHDDHVTIALGHITALREIIAGIKETLDAVSRRAQDRNGVPVDLGKRAATQCTSLDAALIGLAEIEEQVRA